jgi:hypothetical protein
MTDEGGQGHGEWKVVHRHGDALAADVDTVVGRLTPPEPAG